MTTSHVRLSRRDFMAAAGASLMFAASGTEAAAAGPDFSSTRAAAAEMVKVMLSDVDIPSISYALIGRDGLIWADAAGYIDAAQKQPPGSDTRYCIGSCSKVFATVAMMKLIGQGKAALDDPLVKHVPAFRTLSDGYDAITLRMLMSHSSGLPGSEYRGAICSRWNPAYADEVLATAAISRLKHRPGEMSVYCNDGFTLLELVIRAVTGLTYVDFVAQEILEPLGMRLSHYANVADAEGSIAPGFFEGRRLPREVVNCAASGGLYTTPGDLARFLPLFLNDGRAGGIQLLSPENVREMGQNQSAREPFRPLGGADGFGLGWDSVKSPAFASLGLTAWRKNGGTAVYASDLIVLPEAGLAVAVTGASTSFPSGKLAEHILLAALTEQGRLNGMPQPVGPVAAPVATGKTIDAAWTDGVFANYNQVFRLVPNGSGGLDQYKAEGGAWKKRLDNLLPRTDGGLASDARPGLSFNLLEYEGFTFLTGRSAPDAGTVVSDGLGAQKLLPRGELSPAWKRRMGKTWLFANAPADIFMPGMQKLTLSLAAFPELKGYVVMDIGIGGEAMNQPVDASTDDMRALMCIKCPVNPGRDLEDLVVLQRGEEEWLQYGSWVARPADSVPRLEPGAGEVVIGDEGYAAWLRLADAGWLDIEGASDWMLFDADYGLLASGRGAVSDLNSIDAAFLLLYGPAGARVQVRQS